MTDNRPGIVIYRDRMAGVWMRSDRAVVVDLDVQHRTGYSSAELAGTVVRAIQRTNPGERVGVRASDIGPSVELQCRLEGYGDVLWMR